jgi:hypothetical protein
LFDLFLTNMADIKLSDNTIVSFNNGHIMIKNVKEKLHIILTAGEFEILKHLIKRKLQMSFCSHDEQFKGWCCTEKYDDGSIRVLMENVLNPTSHIYLDDKEIKVLDREYLNIINNCIDSIED